MRFSLGENARFSSLPITCSICKVTDVHTEARRKDFTTHWPDMSHTFESLKTSHYLIGMAGTFSNENGKYFLPLQRLITTDREFGKPLLAWRK